MIRIPRIGLGRTGGARGGRGRGGRWSRRVRHGATAGIRRGGRGRASINDRLVDEFDLVEGNRDQVFAHAEETANAKHHRLDVPALVDQEVVDRTQLLFVVVVDGNTNDLRGTQVTLQLGSLYRV